MQRRDGDLHLARLRRVFELEGVGRVLDESLLLRGAAWAAAAEAGAAAQDGRGDHEEEGKEDGEKARPEAQLEGRARKLSCHRFGSVPGICVPEGGGWTRAGERMRGVREG